MKIDVSGNKERRNHFSIGIRKRTFESTTNLWITFTVGVIHTLRGYI